MAPKNEYTVAELLAMTGDEIRENAKTMPFLKGFDDLTEVQQAEVIQQIQAKLQSTPISLDAVNEQLLASLSRSRSATPPKAPTSPSGWSTTPEPPTREERLRDIIQTELVAYRALIADGCRPTHDPQDMARSIVDDPNGQSPIIRYWLLETSSDSRILQDQKEHWDRFQQYQDREKREESIFLIHEQNVIQYWKETHDDTKINLQQVRTLQRNLSDWKERLYYEKRRVDQRNASVTSAEKKLEAAQAQLQAVESDQSSSRDTRDRHGAACHGLKQDLSWRRYCAEQQIVLFHWVEDQVSAMASKEQENVTGGDGSCAPNSRGQGSVKSHPPALEQGASAAATTTSAKEPRRMPQEDSDTTSNRRTGSLDSEQATSTAKDGRTRKNMVVKSTSGTRNRNGKPECLVSALTDSQSAMGGREQENEAGCRQSPAASRKPRSTTQAGGVVSGSHRDRAGGDAKSSTQAVGVRRSARFAEKRAAQLRMA